jgi:hypothetical protein
MESRSRWWWRSSGILGSEIKIRFNEIGLALVGIITYRFDRSGFTTRSAYTETFNHLVEIASHGWTFASHRNLEWTCLAIRSA